MTRRSIWIVNGEARAAAHDPPHDDAWRLMNEQGAVRLVSGPAGTELRWVVASPHVGSLFSAEAMLQYLQAPVMLRFYVAGWFEERLETVEEAAGRIRALVMNADRHLSSRVFVHEPDVSSARVPGLLQDVLREKAVGAEHSVECRYEPELDGFVVCRVGERSAIGRIWGTDQSTFPCLATGALGRSASQSYGRAVSQGVPVYEQVIAALRFPDQTLRWVPYHRVILPIAERRVRVASEYGDVDFRVL